MRKIIFAAALAAGTTLLGGCGGTAEAPAAKAEAGIPGMTISDARMVLAPVPGNPAAVYFTLAYDNDHQTTLTRATVEGAKMAMFHDYGEYDFKVQMMEMGPQLLTKGTRIEFKPGGKHLMAMDVSPDLKPGGTAKITLFVAGGASQTFDAKIVAAGDER